MTSPQLNVANGMTAVDAPPYVNEKIPLHSGEQQQQQQSQVMPQQIIQVAPLPDPNYAYELEAVKATYQRFVTIQLDTKQKIPNDLASRGLSDETFIEIVKKVKRMKTISNTNKILLWTSCICCCSIIGFLLVHCRSLGNKKLSDQLAPILEATNQELGTRGINVRFGWVQGNLRAYFR